MKEGEADTSGEKSVYGCMCGTNGTFCDFDRDGDWFHLAGSRPARPPRHARHRTGTAGTQRVRQTILIGDVTGAIFRESFFVVLVITAQHVGHMRTPAAGRIACMPGPA